jgi:uncharacterized integral membrane protein
VAYRHADEGEPVKRQGFRPSPRQLASAIVIFVVVLFAVVNLERVSVDFVVTSVDIPLAFLILGSLLLGLAAGWLLGERHEHHRDHND